jgi:large subunit ribosomal protein L16
MGINTYKKYHKKNKILKSERKDLRTVKKGLYGLKALTSGIVTPEQLETARRIVSRITKRIGKIFINVFCNYPQTKKPLLSRMGKGVGGIDN